jgi:hypothetical protein
MGNPCLGPTHFPGGWPTLSLILLPRVPRSCRVFRDGAGTLTLTVAEEPRGNFSGQEVKTPALCLQRTQTQGRGTRLTFPV